MFLQTSVPRRTTRGCHFPEDIILHCYRRERIKSYNIVPYEEVNQNKQSLWPLVRKRNILTERPPLVDEL
jgi:hypothetical protein